MRNPGNCTSTVWAYCLAHLDDEGYVRPLQQDIAQALGFSRSAVHHAFKQLRSQGVLRHAGQRWERVVTQEGTRDAECSSLCLADAHPATGSHVVAATAAVEAVQVRAPLSDVGTGLAAVPAVSTAVAGEG